MGNGGISGCTENAGMNAKEKHGKLAQRIFDQDINEPSGGRDDEQCSGSRNGKTNTVDAGSAAGIWHIGSGGTGGVAWNFY